jgi:hypothetical protein
MKKDGEFLFAQELGHAAGGGDVPRRQGREGGRIEVFRLARGGDELSVFVHQEDDFRVRLLKKTLQFRVYLLEFFFIHHQVGTQHVCLPVQNVPVVRSRSY